MHLLIRIFIFVTMTALVVTAPWYVALVFLGGVLLFTGWYEMLLLALAADIMMGAGVYASALPVISMCGIALILARTLVSPYLLSNHSLGQV